jgi:hypothetical protein
LPTCSVPFTVNPSSTVSVAPLTLAPTSQFPLTVTPSKVPLLTINPAPLVAPTVPPLTVPPLIVALLAVASEPLVMLKVPPLNVKLVTRTLLVRTTEPLDMTAVSLLPGTPPGNQLPAVDQSLLVFPVHVRVVCARSPGEKDIHARPAARRRQTLLPSRKWECGRLIAGGVRQIKCSIGDKKG